MKPFGVVVIGGGVIGASVAHHLLARMHSPAIGRLVAELVLDGYASSMNIEPPSLTRFARGTAAAEATTF